MKWIDKKIPKAEENKNFTYACGVKYKKGWKKKKIEFSQRDMDDYTIAERYVKSALSWTQYRISSDQKDDKNLENFRVNWQRNYHQFPYAFLMKHFNERGAFLELPEKLYSEIDDSKKPENAYLNWQLEVFKHNPTFMVELPDYDVLVHHHVPKHKEIGEFTANTHWGRVWNAWNAVGGDFSEFKPFHSHIEDISYTEFLRRVMSTAMGFTFVMSEHELYPDNAEFLTFLFEAYPSDFETIDVEPLRLRYEVEKRVEHFMSQTGKSRQALRQNARTFDQDNMYLGTEGISFVFQSSAEKHAPKYNLENKTFTVSFRTQDDLAAFISNAEGIDKDEDESNSENEGSMSEMSSAVNLVMKILAFCSKDEFIERYKPKPQSSEDDKNKKENKPRIPSQTKILLPKKIVSYAKEGESGHGSSKGNHQRKHHWRRRYEKDKMGRRRKDINGKPVVAEYFAVRSCHIHEEDYDGEKIQHTSYLVDSESTIIDQLKGMGASNSAVIRTLERIRKKKGVLV